MTEIDPSVAQSAVQEQTITVPQGHNTLVISIREHSWVSISIDDQEIASNHTPAPSLSLAVSPGTYIVCTITVEAVALDGTPLTGQAQQGEVFLRTTGGILLDAAGENRIRSVTLKAGRAAFRLVSEASPKVETVSAFGQGPALLKAEIQIEFV